MIAVGTKIICPNDKCRTEIAEVCVEINYGDRIGTHNIKGISQDIIFLDMTNCKKCLSPYFHRGALHTENGWQRG